MAQMTIAIVADCLARRAYNQKLHRIMIAKQASTEAEAHSEYIDEAEAHSNFIQVDSGTHIGV